ncbi:MAG: hypothetical protein NTX31_05735 [Burkholderiales bacterium]|jgi:predicted small secreted protein|nr:hypothetical protein [Burkholderiales bacterium]
MTKRRVFIWAVAGALSVAVAWYVVRAVEADDRLKSEEQQRVVKEAAKALAQIAAESAAIAASDAARVVEEAQYRVMPR